jgi:protein-tyrosine-phosphatase
MSEAAPVEPRPTTYNLLFVCTGNTCRSPMALAIARHMITQRGWSHVAVESAGIAATPGGSASAHAIDAAAEAGLDLSDHQTRPLDEDLVSWADLIFAMSPTHLRAVEELGGGEKAALITEFLEGDDAGRGIEDPYGSDLETYRLAFQQLEAAVEGVLARLEPILSP